ncbi:MAG: hypothetical protein ACRC50_12830 [Gaiella sp.]
MRTRIGLVWAVLVGVCLAVPSAALAEPPANDNRADALVIPTFPATVEGSTVEATVERLDPQISDCGRVESTVWYRIPRAPDGTIVLGVQGAGFAPVLRVYSVRTNAIDEVACASAKRSGEALLGFETQRGASYLVLVGRRPGTADAAFTLTARLYFPPPNDASGQARRIAVPATVKGSTFGATDDDEDPYSCDLDGGTVWYRVAPGKAQRVVLRLAAAGDLDASVAVIGRVRSKSRVVTCARTDRRGRAVAAFTVEPGTSYTLVVGQQEGSPPGAFILRTLEAQALEKAPGQRLPLQGVRATVNGLVDVNDMWWTTMTAGSSYRISLTSEQGCVRVKLTSPLDRSATFSCDSYSPFTPGPDGGGRYVFEVLAPPGTRPVPYRLRVAPARVDDIGVGLALRNLSVRRGALSPSSVDVVDLYHFDVVERSDVRLRLAQAKGRRFGIELMTDTGRTLRRASDEINRKLDRGRYVVAVAGEPGTPGGAYGLGLVVRRVTSTTLVASATEIVPGASVVLTIATDPVPERGWTELQIDRFDPLTGWEFNRKIRVRGTGAELTWRPPAPGRWRVRALFLGTLRSSPSRSPYVRLLVATPLPEEDA